MQENDNLPAGAGEQETIPGEFQEEVAVGEAEAGPEQATLVEESVEEAPEEARPAPKRRQRPKRMPHIQVSPFQTVLGKIPEGGYCQVGDKLYQVESIGIGINVVELKPVGGGFEEVVRFTSGAHAKCRAVEVTK